MKTKQTKKESKQIVEIHIYIHQVSEIKVTPHPITYPPYYVTCQSN